MIELRDILLRNNILTPEIVTVRDLGRLKTGIKGSPEPKGGPKGISRMLILVDSGDILEDSGDIPGKLRP